MRKRRDEAQLLEDLQRKRAQLQARVEQLGQRLAAKRRKEDHRRRILLGEFLLAQMSSDDALRRLVQERLRTSPTSPRDADLMRPVVDGTLFQEPAK